MTKQTTVVDVSSFTTDAKFRTWGLAMSTALQATPLVKTSDTGQINWASVTKPVATNTKAGYEIYRFSDSLQASKPVFIRVDYGSGGVASGNSPCTWITVGTGTDGAGTITGANSGALQGYNVNTTISNTTMTGYFTHTTNGYALLNFGLGLAFNQANNAGSFIVARTVHPTTGAATGDGVVIHRLLYAASSNSQYGINFNTSTAYTTPRSPAAGMLNLGYSIATAGLVPLAKCYAPLGDLYPSSATLAYYTSDVTTLSTFTASPFGTTHTYLAWGGNVGYFSSAGANDSNACAATIWED